MGKRDKSSKELVQKAIIDSMNFSKEKGDQVFIHVSPHVSMVSFRAYKGGWKEGKDPLFDFSIYLDGELAKHSEEVKEMLKPIYDFIENRVCL